MKFFDLAQNKTSVKQEFGAGLTTFLAMMYIVPVNAIIMSKTGMPYEALITATALITIFSTILNGLWANTPVAMSVGMGLNAYFTFGLCIGMKVPWQTALGVVFLSGVIFVVLSFTNFRMWIIRSIPLVYQRENNYLKDVKFLGSAEILKTMAISRLVLDNVPHIKAYWATSTLNLAMIAQEFGADDLDGTIEKESIQSAAGANSANGVTLKTFCDLIKTSGFTPVERDSLYNELKIY